MSIEQTVQEVEEVFRGLEVEISNFKQWSGLHCKTGCVKCCLKPDVEATVLEFVPLAYKLYRDGQAIQWYERLQAEDFPYCKILDEAGGKCSMYNHRGLICRLFGYAARVNKHGARELVTCQVIKTEQSENFQSAVVQIAAGISVPVMSRYYMQLGAIDRELGRQLLPINKAVKKAIEYVLQYYAYRDDAVAAV